MQYQHLLRTNVSIQKQLSQAPALQRCATNSNVMPHTKSKIRDKRTTTKVVVKHAKPTVQNTTPRPGASGALSSATQRNSISVAELPSTRRATSNRDRMVRHPTSATFLIPVFCSDCVKYCCNTLLIGAVASAKSSHVHSRCSGDQVDLHGADTAPVDIGGIGVDCASRNERIGGS